MEKNNPVAVVQLQFDKWMNGRSCIHWSVRLSASLCSQLLHKIFSSWDACTRAHTCAHALHGHTNKHLASLEQWAKMLQLLITHWVACSKSGCSYNAVTLSCSTVILLRARTNDIHTHTALLSFVLSHMPLMMAHSSCDNGFFFSLFPPLFRLVASLLSP